MNDSERCSKWKLREHSGLSCTSLGLPVCRTSFLYHTIFGGGPLVPRRPSIMQTLSSPTRTSPLFLSSSFLLRLAFLAMPRVFTPRDHPIPKRFDNRRRRTNMLYMEIREYRRMVTGDNTLSDDALGCPRTFCMLAERAQNLITAAFVGNADDWDK